MARVVIDRGNGGLKYLDPAPLDQYDRERERKRGEGCGPFDLMMDMSSFDVCLYLSRIWGRKWISRRWSSHLLILVLWESRSVSVICLAFKSFIIQSVVSSVHRRVFILLRLPMDLGQSCASGVETDIKESGAYSLSFFASCSVLKIVV